jgi:uncharacterized protein (DUF2336 family)
MAGEKNDHVRQSAAPNYEDAKRAAISPTRDDRVALAQRSGVPAEILYFLARDTAAEVRQAVAGNADTPLKADLLLTGDGNDRIRADLVRKAVSRIASNELEEPPPLDRLMVEILMQLSADPNPNIRALLANAARECRHLPAKVARCLAMDPDGRVAGPIVGESPVLTDEDLLSVLHANPPAGVIGSMARRDGLSTKVAAGIVDSGNSDAIGCLLANKSAQIREETLDAVLEHAPDHPSWHRPLVYRPALTGSAMRKLSQFVALGLLEALASRPDIDSDTAEALTEILRTRLTTESHPLDSGPPLPLVQTPDPANAGAGAAAAGIVSAGDEAKVAASERRAIERHAQGILTVDDIDDAIFAGDRPFVVVALALLAKAPKAAVNAVLDTRSPKGIVALCWKAQLPMRIAIKIQTHIGHVQPIAVLHARGGTDYPIPTPDLKRQLEFFGIR